MVEGLRLEGGHSQSGEWEERAKTEREGGGGEEEKVFKGRQLLCV